MDVAPEVNITDMGTWLKQVKIRKVENNITDIGIIFQTINRYNLGSSML